MESNEDDFFGEQGSADDAALRERQWAALRKEHMKAGFREGSKLGHEAEMQTGFDAGFHAGAKATADAGFWYVCAFSVAAKARIAVMN